MSLAVDQVRIRMAAAEIGQRRAVDHRALGGAEDVFEDAVRVWAGHGVHAHRTACVKPPANMLAIAGKSNSVCISAA